MEPVVERIAALARTERDAESRQELSKIAWRRAWWELTISLGSVEDTPRAILSQAYDLACDITGQSRGRMSARRSVGAKVKDLQAGMGNVPPETAMEWVLAGRNLDGEGVAQLTRYDREGLSKRDVLRIIADEDQTEVRASMRTAQDYADTAAQVRRAVERDPAIAREVAQSPAVRREVDSQRVEHARRSFADAGLSPQRPNAGHAETVKDMRALDLTAQARQALRAATDALADKGLDEEMRSALSDRADSIERALIAFRQAISGDVDEALARLLEEEDAR